MVVSRLGSETWEGTNIVDSLILNVQLPEHNDFPLCHPSLPKMATAVLVVAIRAGSISCWLTYKKTLTEGSPSQKGKATQAPNSAG